MYLVAVGATCTKCGFQWSQEFSDSQLAVAAIESYGTHICEPAGQGVLWPTSPEVK